MKKDPANFITSAITPGFIVNVYCKCYDDSQSILFITISSALSAVSQSTNLAADIIRAESPDTEIRIVDSKTCAGTKGLVVLSTVKAANVGLNIDELTEFTENAHQETGLIMFLDTLKYIYRTGRMSKTASRLASVFNIRPINRVTDEGTVDFVYRVRKRPDSFNKIIELINEQTETKSLHFMISHADASNIAQDFSDQLHQEFDCLSVIISDFSPVMGYGAGPGAFFVGFRPDLDL